MNFCLFVLQAQKEAHMKVRSVMSGDLPPGLSLTPSAHLPISHPHHLTELSVDGGNHWPACPSSGKRPTPVPPQTESAADPPCLPLEQQDTEDPREANWTDSAADYRGKQLHHWSLDQFDSKYFGTDFQRRPTPACTIPIQIRCTCSRVVWKESWNFCSYYCQLKYKRWHLSKRTGLSAFGSTVSQRKLGTWTRNPQSHTPKGTRTSLCACRRWEHTCMMKSLLMMNVSVHNPLMLL